MYYIVILTSEARLVYVVIASNITNNLDTVKNVFFELSVESHAL